MGIAAVDSASVKMCARVCVYAFAACEGWQDETSD